MERLDWRLVVYKVLPSVESKRSTIVAFSPKSSLRLDVEGERTSAEGSLEGGTAVGGGGPEVLMTEFVSSLAISAARDEILLSAVATIASTFFCNIHSTYVLVAVRPVPADKDNLDQNSIKMQERDARA